MVLLRILPDDEEELITPSGEVAGIDVKNHQDRGADILHRDSLGVQVRDGGGLVEEEGLAELRRLEGVGAGVGEVVIDVGTCLLDVSQGILHAHSGVIARLEVGLSFLLGSRGTR